MHANLKLKFYCILAGWPRGLSIIVTATMIMITIMILVQLPSSSYCYILG